MSKLKFLLMFLLIAVIPAVFAADLNINNVTSSSAVTPTSAFTVSFRLANAHATENITYSNYNVSVAGLGIASATTISSYSATSGQVNNNSLSGVITSGALTVPQYTLTDLYPVTITVNGNYSNGTAITNSTTFANILNVTNSPVLTVTWIPSSQNIFQGYNTTAVANISNSGNVDFSAVSINVTTANVTFSATPIALVRGASSLWTLGINTTKNTNFGSNAIALTAVGLDATALLNATTTSSSNVNVVYRYCGLNSTTERITISEISNEEDISGETYAPLDNFNIDIEVENSYDEDRTVVVNAVLVFENKKLEDTEAEKTIEVNNDDTKSTTLNITIPADAEEGTYSLYIKAYDDDSTKYCEQEVITFTVEKSTSHKLIPYGLSVDPTNVSCEGTYTVKGTLANIGAYNEDQVKLVYSDKWTTLERYYDNLDKGDEVTFEFQSIVPKNETEGLKTFTLKMYSNYDEDDEDYKKSESKTFSLFSVSGNCVKESKNVTITSDVSTTQVFTGSQSEVKVLVSNTGTLKQTYTVEVPTVSWATIGSISPASFELEPGVARYVSVKLTPNANVTGSQSMDVKVSYSGTTQTKTLSLNVQKVSEVSNLFERIKFSVSRDWIWYGIGVVAAVIIVMIFAISSASTKAAAVKAAMTQTKIKQYKNY